MDLLRDLLAVNIIFTGLFINKMVFLNLTVFPLPAAHVTPAIMHNAEQPALHGAILFQGMGMAHGLQCGLLCQVPGQLWVMTPGVGNPVQVVPVVCQSGTKPCRTSLKNTHFIWPVEGLFLG
jgi:hypothetical protein